MHSRFRNVNLNELPGHQFSSVQSLSHVWLFAAPWTAARQASLSITNSRSSPKPMSIESVIPSNHLILCRPLLLPSIFPSIRVFANKSAHRIRWAKYWSSASISPSNEHTRLLSFRMDWLDRLAVQGTLKSLFQHHSSKVSSLWHSAFFIVQLSHPYMTTGKTRSRIVWVWLTYRGLTLLLELASKPRWYKHRYYSSTLLEVKFWYFWLFLLETSRGSSYAWDSPGKNTGVDWHALLQGIFPIQGWNLYLLSLTLAGGFFTTSTIWEVLRGRPQGKLLHKDYCLFLKSHENSLKGFKQWECC